MTPPRERARKFLHILISQGFRSPDDSYQAWAEAETHLAEVFGDVQEEIRNGFLNGPKAKPTAERTRVDGA